MRYYLMHEKEPTACFDTTEQFDQFAVPMKESWYDQSGLWYIKVVWFYFFEIALAVWTFDGDRIIKDSPTWQYQKDAGI